MAASRPSTGSLYDQGEARLVAGLDTWIVRAGPQGGTPVVFLHGMPTSAYAWRDVMRAMHEEHECIAFDWPGFGSSAKPRHAGMTHRARADHLAAVLDALRVPRAHLVAHDLGGPAAALFAVENPARVASLALLGTTVLRRDDRAAMPALAPLVPLVRGLARPLLQRGAFDLAFKQGLHRPERVPKSVLDHHWKLATRDGGKRALVEEWAQLHEGAPTLDAIRAKAGELRAPVLVLFGAEDRLLPPPAAERLAKVFPRATLQLLPGAGHFVMEDAPEEVADRLLSFLREQEVA